MPIATPAQYAAMLDAAQDGNYAYPAMNVTSLTTINGALKAFADKKSDGIIQVSTGGGQFASGLDQKDAVLGSIILAEATHRLAERYDILIALHTDHCQPGKVDGFLKPLIAETARRREAGLPNLFQSHMLDASELPLKENLELSVELLKLCAANEIILEVEAGVVGGEEDGVDNSDQPAEKTLYISRRHGCSLRSAERSGSLYVCSYFWKRAWQLQTGRSQTPTRNPERRSGSCHRQIWQGCSI